MPYQKSSTNSNLAGKRKRRNARPKLNIDPPYYNLTEAAAYLRVSKKTLYRRIEAGLLTPHRERVSKKILLLRAEVHALVQPDLGLAPQDEFETCAGAH